MSSGESNSTSSVVSDDWHGRLTETLGDCGVQRAPRHPVLGYLLAIVIVIATMVLARGLMLILIDIQRDVGNIAIYIGYPLWILFLLLVVYRIRNYFMRRAWQSGARSAEKEIQRDSSRRPILYLRSFRLDKLLAERSWMEKYLGTPPMANAEQLVTKELRKLGPVIAIGRPGEKLPALGAARFYVAHDRWQEKVAAVMKESQLVLWATGETEGLRWELDHLVENMDPTKIILWAHPSLIPGNTQKREAAWQNFRTTLGEVFPKPLPDTLGKARFFRFYRGWNPQAYESTSWGIIRPKVTSAIRHAAGIQPNLRWMKYLRVACISALVVLGLGIIYGIFWQATPQIIRQRDFGYLKPAAFFLAAVALGVGVAVLAVGIALWRRAKLKLVWILGMIPLVAVAYWLAVISVGSSLYWPSLESAYWKQMANGSYVDDYRFIPGRYKRIEAYPMITDYFEKKLVSQDGLYEFEVQRVLDEVESHPERDSELRDVRDRLNRVLVMSTKIDSAASVSKEYVMFWTETLEQSNMPPEEKSQRAYRLMQELGYASIPPEEKEQLRTRLQTLSNSASGFR